jgi:hypothetical protein
MKVKRLKRRKKLGMNLDLPLISQILTQINPNDRAYSMIQTNQSASHEASIFIKVYHRHKVFLRTHQENQFQDSDRVELKSKKSN